MWFLTRRASWRSREVRIKLKSQHRTALGSTHIQVICHQLRPLSYSFWRRDGQVCSYTYGGPVRRAIYLRGGAEAATCSRLVGQQGEWHYISRSTLFASRCDMALMRPFLKLSSLSMEIQWSLRRPWWVWIRSHGCRPWWRRWSLSGRIGHGNWWIYQKMRDPLALNGFSPEKRHHQSKMEVQG